MNYETTSYTENPYKKNFEPSELNAEKKRDLRRTHYELGSDKNIYESNYMEEFHKHPLGCKAAQDPSMS